VRTASLLALRVNNKWSQNFDKRPHRLFVTPRGGEWIRPTLTLSNIHGSFDPYESCHAPKRHLDRFSRFYRAQHTHAETDHATESVAIAFTMHTVLPSNTGMYTARISRQFCQSR